MIIAKCLGVNAWGLMLGPLWGSSISWRPEQPSKAFASSILPPFFNDNFPDNIRVMVDSFCTSSFFTTSVADVMIGVVFSILIDMSYIVGFEVIMHHLSLAYFFIDGHVLRGTFHRGMINLINLEKKMAYFKELEQAHGAKRFEMVANGMQVILMPNAIAPVAGFQVTYHVGSRNEGVGHTGATHLLEHLMFKGSKNFNKEKNNNIDQLENVGAILNATTWLDRTNYFEVLPKAHLEKAIAIEADRMRHAFIAEEDRQAEMTVVRNEFERDENSPMSALHKNMWSTAYVAHPYHHNTIGWLSDIENVSIERLKAFYDTFYWPNNATVTVVGDFEETAVLDLIQKYFGHISRSAHEIPEVYTTEPKQDGPKRLVVKRSGSPGIVAVAFKTPKGLDEAHLHMQLISGVLQMGKSSRLYKRLVAKGLALSLYAEDYPNIDEGLLVLYASLTPKATHEEVEAIILEEIEKIKSKTIPVAELERVKAMIEADQVYQRGSFFSSLNQVNEAIALKDWRYYLDLPEKMAKISGEAIQITAKKYLDEDQSTTGYFVPKEGV